MLENIQVQQKNILWLSLKHKSTDSLFIVSNAQTYMSHSRCISSQISHTGSFINNDFQDLCEYS